MKNPVGKLAIVLCAGLVVGLVCGCSQASDQPPEPAQMVDTGSWYSREQWPHDGNPYESQNFIVYSDAAGQDKIHIYAYENRYP